MAAADAIRMESILKYLIDSNVLIEHLNGACEATNFIQNHWELSGISAVTKIEVLGFPFPTQQAESGAEELINAMELISISEKIVEQTIRLRKMTRIKIPDAIIASTALNHQLVLVTRNIEDFKNLKGLRYMDPFALKP